MVEPDISIWPNRWQEGGRQPGFLMPGEFHNSKVWPNFFVVGAAKAGTTSVHAYLSQHPEVFFSAIKEPHYFAQVTPTREHRYSVEAITDRAEYLRLFRHANRYQVVGDASSSYLWHPQVASASGGARRDRLLSLQAGVLSSTRSVRFSFV